MPMESETDRAVADILGKYITECRANQEKEKNKGDGESKTMIDDKVEEVKQNPRTEPTTSSTHESKTASTSSQIDAQEVQQTTTNPGTGAMCTNANVPATAADLATFNLNELNSGQFTVDLSGITIPEGGAINFDELINNGRLIYIQTTDSEANKENESSQAIILVSANKY